ncbi:MAG: TM2 domain-containing protein [Myxococcota bacterium]|nr:TM2 domain-containing protein [Myxococcota bacterium]
MKAEGCRLRCRAQPRQESPMSDESKKKQMALILAGAPLAFGFAGIHRIYAGHIGTGILQLLTFGGCGVWQLIDIIQIIKGDFKDANGNPLVE